MYCTIHQCVLVHTQTVLWSKWSLRILEDTCSQRQTVFYSSPVLLQLLASSCQFCMWVPFLAVTPPHLALVADQSWFCISSWGLRSSQLVEQQCRRRWKQSTCSVFQSVSSCRSIMLLDVRIQDVCFGLFLCVCAFWCAQLSVSISTVMRKICFMPSECWTVA